MVRLTGETAITGGVADFGRNGQFETVTNSTGLASRCIRWAAMTRRSATCRYQKLGYFEKPLETA
jgi:hypothetical protein